MVLEDRYEALGSVQTAVLITLRNYQPYPGSIADGMNHTFGIQVTLASVASEWHSKHQEQAESIFAPQSFSHFYLHIWKCLPPCGCAVQKEDGV